MSTQKDQRIKQEPEDKSVEIVNRDGSGASHKQDEMNPVLDKLRPASGASHAKDNDPGDEGTDPAPPKRQ